MKSLKLLGAVAVVVLALGIVGGVGRASATTICSKNVNPCTSSFAEKTVYSAKLKQDTLFLFNLTNRCTESEIVFETQKNMGKGAALTGEVTYLGFDKCTSCPVKAIHLPYKAEIKPTKGGNGTLTMSNNTAGNPGFVQEKCGGLICEYATAWVTFEFFGGQPAILSLPFASTLLAKQKNSDFKCTADMEWRAEYKLETPVGEIWVEPEP